MESCTGPELSLLDLYMRLQGGRHEIIAHSSNGSAGQKKVSQPKQVERRGVNWSQTAAPISEGPKSHAGSKNLSVWLLGQEGITTHNLLLNHFIDFITPNTVMSEIFGANGYISMCEALCVVDKGKKVARQH